MAEKKNCQTENNHDKNDVEMRQQYRAGAEHGSYDKDVVTSNNDDDDDDGKVGNEDDIDRDAEQMRDEVPGGETVPNSDDNLRSKKNGETNTCRLENTGSGLLLNCEAGDKCRENEADCSESEIAGEEDKMNEDEDDDRIESDKTNPKGGGEGRGAEVVSEGEKHDSEGGARVPDEIGAEGDRLEVKKKQRRIRRNVLMSSDEDEDDTDGEADGEKEDEDDDDTAFEDNLLEKQFPPPLWHPVHAHFKRQCGEYKTPWAFSHQAIGNFGLVQRFERYCALDTHEGCVNTLHFNQCGDRLASGSDDLKIAVWDWAKKDPVLVYDSGHKRNVFQAKFMPNSGDTTLVSCARDGQVRVSELSSTGVCKATKRVAQHKAPAHKLGLEVASPVIFMSCGEDAVVWNVDLREAKPTKALSVKQGVKKIPLYTIHINPSNKNEFAVGGRDKYLRIYDRRKLSETESEPPVKKYCPHHLMSDDNNVNITCSVYSYDGQEILVSYNDDEIYLFDNTHSDGSDFIHQYQGHRNNATVKGVNFYGARSEFVVSGSDCGNVFLWSKDTERIVQLMHGDVGGVVNCLEPHPTAPILATSGLDNDVKIWMPTAQDPVDIKKHKKTLQKNRLEREEERNREPSQLESQMFMFLLQHLRRSNRRQAREEDDDLLDSDDDNSSDSDSDEDENDDDDLTQQEACAPS